MHAHGDGATTGHGARDEREGLCSSGGAIGAYAKMAVSGREIGFSDKGQGSRDGLGRDNIH